MCHVARGHRADKSRKHGAGGLQEDNRRTQGSAARPDFAQNPDALALGDHLLEPIHLETGRTERTQRILRTIGTVPR